MKVHQFAAGLWDQDLSSASASSSSSSSTSSSSSLTISFKRLRPLAPKLTSGAAATAAAAAASADPTPSLDLKSPTASNSKCTNPDPSQVETQSGGTRWNPMPDQIRVLEVLYRSGMRTPNAHQIKRITAELSKYGRIEGKNVFYWFQNHKARERQKQKRTALLALANNSNNGGENNNNCSRGNTSPLPTVTLFSSPKVEEEIGIREFNEGTACKRKCRSFELDVEESGTNGTTLELFPLHPEGKQMR